MGGSGSLFFSFLMKDNVALEGFGCEGFGSTFSLLALDSAGFGFQFFHCLRFRPGFSVSSAAALFFTSPFATRSQKKKV